MKNKLFAVLTGDIVGSTKIKSINHKQLLSCMRSSFDEVMSIMPNVVYASFEIYRGDSFQGVLTELEKVVKAMLVIRTRLQSGFGADKLALDTRRAVGIGRIDYLPENRIAEAKGEAFILSDTALNDMKVDQRLAFRTPWKQVSDEINAECALLDALINRWTPKQAEAVLLQLHGLTQQEAGKRLGISQPAVRKRLERAGGWAIKQLCNRYETIIAQTVQFSES